MFDIKKILNEDQTYVTTFPDGRKYHWRLLTLKEYKVLNGLKRAGILPALFVYDEVFDLAYLGNNELDDKIGVRLTIGQMIFFLSGDVLNIDPKAEITRFREKEDKYSILAIIQRRILGAFPSLTMKEIESWTYPKVMEYFTLAENILEDKGVEPLNINQITNRSAIVKEEKQNKNVINWQEEKAEDTVHPLDMMADKLVEKSKKNSFNLETARKLDEMYKKMENEKK